MFQDSDFAGDLEDSKSTFGGHLWWRTERRGVRFSNRRCFGGWEGRGLACKSRTCCHFGQDDPARNFEEEFYAAPAESHDGVDWGAREPRWER